MITIRNTPNAAGVIISGDFEDLYNLVEAFYKITIGDYVERHHQYIPMSTRVLGLCYDIRHAYQGDREIELIDNQMTEEIMAWHSLIAPQNNVYYSCRYLYPEMFFVMLALNQLVDLHSGDHANTKGVLPGERRNEVIWDDSIAMIRLLQAQFASCVRNTLTDAAFSRWMKAMSSDQADMRDIAGQYLDLLAIDYIPLTRKQRLQALPALAERIVGFQEDVDHKEIARVVNAAAEEWQCEPGDIQLEGIEYPNCFEW